MTSIKIKNHASTPLDGGIDDSVVSLAVVDATKFYPITGAEYFYATIQEIGDFVNVEIVKVTAIVGNIVTVERGAEGSTPRAFPTNSAFEQRVTAQTMADLTANMPVLDEAANTFTLPATADGQTLDLGQEQFVVVSTPDVTPALTLNPEVFLVTQYDATCGCQSVIRPVAADMKEGDVFGINTTDIPAESAGSGKITTFGSISSVDTSAWLVGDHLYIDPAIAGKLTNIQPSSNAFAVGHVLVVDAVDGRLFANTTRGVSDAASFVPAGASIVYFTADVDGSFLSTSQSSEGVAVATTQGIVVNDDQTLPLPTDWLSFLVPIPASIKKGELTSSIYVETSSLSANEQVRIEMYLTDAVGAPLASGVAGAPVGTLGVTVISILDSGVLNFTATGVSTLVALRSVLNETIQIAVNQRIRYRVLMSKVGTTGGSKSMIMHYGLGIGSTIHLPLPLFAGDVISSPAGMVNVSATQVQESMEQLDAGIESKMKWIVGGYAGLPSIKNDVLTGDGFTVVCINDSEDYPFPVTVGDPFKVFDGSLSPATTNAKQLLLGTRYILEPTDEPLLITSYEVEVVAGNHYEIFSVVDPLGAKIANSLHAFVATVSETLTIGVTPTVMEAGTTFDALVRINEPAVSPATWTANWDYLGINNALDPIAGQLTQDLKNPSTIKVSKTDYNAVDQTTPLSELVVGDIINIEGVSWSMQSLPVDGGSFYTIGVAPAVAGIPNGVQAVEFETTVATPISYGKAVDAWLGNVNVRGLYSVDDGYENITVNDDQHTINISIQKLSKSDDFEILASVQNTVTPVQDPVLKYAVPKAVFDALAEKRIRDNAGSGFAEWGKHYNATNGYDEVNEGIWVKTLVADLFRMGRGLGQSGAIGVSRTGSPIAQVNGTQHEINEVSYTGAATSAEIKFPPAPDGKKTYDSATGLVVEHASAAEAFEGLVTNGDFRNGITDWDVYSDATLAIVGGRLEVTPTVATLGVATQDIQTDIGTTYRFTVSCFKGTSASYQLWIGDSQGNAALYNSGALSDANKAIDIEFTATATTTVINLVSTDLGGTSLFDNVSIMPATESVITSRQDYAFLESFHEKISDKDRVHYLGAVQSGLVNPYGIVSVTRDDGYCRFGEWDTTTTGEEVVWSTLSDTEKRTFLQDPENNIYLDGVDLIQVKYRVRVVEGLGDDWLQVQPRGATEYLVYDAANYIRSQGATITLVDFVPFESTIVYRGSGNSLNQSPSDKGQFSVRDTNVESHNGLCFAVPIALVQRRNQGGYHPTFNPEGCRLFWSNTSGSRGTWYQGSIVPTGLHTSTSHMFIFDKAFNAPDAIGYVAATSGGSGNIGNASGRSDGKFYDAIYASDVQDLRMSSKLLPRTEIREKYKRMAIAGEVRGFEGVPFTRNAVSTVAWVDRIDLAIVTYEVDNTQPEFDWILATTVPAQGFVIHGGKSYKIVGVTKSGTQGINLAMEYALTTLVGEGLEIVYGDYQLHSQANPTWTDIIGEPANIAATFPNGVEGQWVPVISGGTIGIPVNRKSLDSSPPMEYTGDNGATWTASTITINTTTNEYGTHTNFTRLVHYETQALFTQDDVNSKVLDLGGVWGGNFNGVTWGNILQPSLIGKVGIGSGNPLNQEKPLTEFALNSVTKILYVQSLSYPKHMDVALDATGDTAVKTLDYLSESNGVAKLMYAYKEMAYDSTVAAFTDVISVPDGAITLDYALGKLYQFTDVSSKYFGRVYKCNLDYNGQVDSGAFFIGEDAAIFRTSSLNRHFDIWNGNGWGDNNQFEITDNQSTVTDDNGNTALYGTASFNTQYFIVEE